jgi:hypothetical protein
MGEEEESSYEEEVYVGGQRGCASCELTSLSFFRAGWTPVLFAGLRRHHSFLGPGKRLKAGLPEAWVLPSRVCVRALFALDASVVCCGRGDKRLGLPCSMQGTPHSIGRRGARSEVIELFKRWLLSQSS